MPDKRLFKHIFILGTIAMFTKTNLITAAAAICLCPGCEVNPITGEQELMLFPTSQDITIGKKYAPEVEKQLGGRLANESVQSYVDSVGQKIARVCDRREFEYHYAVLDHDSINAFALPGGYVYITKAMLLKMQSEAQLASVLAHETSHIVARDSMNVMSNQIGIDLLLSAATTEDTHQAVITTAQLTRQIIGLKYSRDDEKTADIGGLEYMVRAGYNPYAMVETMQMLQQQQQFEPVEFFSTHPSPANRVEYLSQRIQSRYRPQGLTVGRDRYQQMVLNRLQ